MNGVGRLIQNELIKVIRQTSWKVIFIIFLAFAILGPVLTHLFVSALPDLLGAAITSFIPEGTEGTVEGEYYKVSSDSDAFFEELGIEMSDWRYNLYYNSYCELAESVRGLELIVEGKDIKEVADWFYITNVNCIYDDNWNVTDVTYHADGDLESEGVPMTLEIAEEQFAVEGAQLESLKKDIKEISISDVAEQYVTMLEYEIDAKKENVNTLEGKLNTDKAVINEYETAKYELEVSEATLRIWKNLGDCAPEDENWMIATLSLVEQASYYITQYAIVDENTFAKDEDLVDRFESYEYYTERMKAGYESTHGKLETAVYSVENKLPLPEALTSSTRGYVSGSISSNIGNTLFICLILAATVMSSEYSSGTIRLLVIRPRARWKIMLSKIVCVVICGAALFVATSILSTVTHIIILGTGDLAVPFLTYSNGAVRENVFFIHTVGQALASGLPDMFYVSLALFFSVITKKVVSAVALPILISTVGSAVSSFCINSVGKWPILRATVFPYLDITSLLDTGYSSGLYSTVDISVTGLFGGVPSTPPDVTLLAAVIVLLAHIILVSALTVIIFRRQQIKN